MPQYYDFDEDEEDEENDEDLEKDENEEDENEDDEDEENPEASEDGNISIFSETKHNYPFDYKLSNLLKSRVSIGFATVSSYSDAPNPKIYLEEYGWLREPPVLPSQTFDNHTLETLNGAGYVKFDTSRFTVRNEQWSSFIDTEVLKATQQLGIGLTYLLGSVHLMLCNSPKVITMPQHQALDTNHFGTLMIVLPSDSGTRSVKISGYDEVKSWSESQQETDRVLSCFWLDGMEVTVEGGGDLCAVLLYEVEWNGSQLLKPTARYSLERMEKLKCHLANWTSEHGSVTNESPKFIYHPLSTWYDSHQTHEFSQSDREAVDTLTEVCIATDFTLWLVQHRIMKDYYRMGYYHSRYGMQGGSQNLPEEVTVDASITQFIDPSPLIHDGYKFEHYDLFGENLLRKAHKKRMHDYRYSTMRHASSASGLILLPAGSVDLFLMRYVFAEPEQKGGLEAAFELWKQEPDETRLSTWVQFCNMALETIMPSSRGIISSVLKSILTMSLSISNDAGQEMFFKAFDKWKPYTYGLGPDDYKFLAKAIIRFGWAEIVPKLNEIFIAEGSLDRFQQSLEGFRHKMQLPLEELEATENSQDVIPPLDAIKMWGYFRLLLLVEKTEPTTESAFVALRTVLAKIPEHLLPQFLKVVAESIAKSKIEMVLAYGIFEYFVSRVNDTPTFATVAGAAIQSFLDAFRHSHNLKAEGFAAYIEDIGSRSITHLDLLVKDVLSSADMHSKNGIASRWIAFLPALANVAIRRRDMFTPISNLLTMVLLAYLVLEIGPEPQQDLTFPERTLNCPCQHCAIVNNFLADRNYLDFNGLDLGWSREMCHHVRQLGRGTPIMRSKTNVSFLRQSDKPHLRIRKIDKAYAPACEVRIERRNHYRKILHSVLEIVSRLCPPFYLLGALTQPLQNHDELTCRRFLQTAVDGSLSGAIFELSQEIEINHRQSIKSIIKARGGSVGNSESENSTLAVSRRKRVLVSKNEQGINDASQAYASYHSDNGSTTVSVYGFQKFVDYLWSDSLIARFGSLTTVPSTGVKRKASDLELQPLTKEPNGNISYDSESRTKMARLTDPSVDHDDKENLQREESLEVIDLT